MAGGCHRGRLAVSSFYLGYVDLEDDASRDMSNLLGETDPLADDEQEETVHRRVEGGRERTALSRWASGPR